MTVSILIVDDDIKMIELIEEFLKKNYNTQSALDADEALKIMKFFNADIVLTDIMMQGMDGLALTKHIKQNYSADVMVMTGYLAEYSYEEAINAGASDFIFKPFRLAELDLRIKRVVRENELKKEKARILVKMEQLAITDGLTNLYNSRHFFNMINIEIERHNRYRHHLSLMMLDIDFFKKYNDTWGHLEGDKVLMRMGKVITSCLRTTDMAFRYGGEEFAVLLPETRLQQACLVGNRIKNHIASQVFTPENGKKVSITISIGVTDLVENEKDKSLIQRADKALYHSKASGRNKITSIADKEVIMEIKSTKEKNDILG
jgi:two-component system, cell cycle response regulator